MTNHRNQLAAKGLLMAMLLSSSLAQAHITLPPGGAPSGGLYTAAFRVGHACHDAEATTGIKVRLPVGFKLIDAQPRPGWALSTITPGEVSWTAVSPQAALPGTEKTTFVLRGQVSSPPGTLWFKVLQTCDKGSADWAEIPEPNGAKPEFPAAKLEVLPAADVPTPAADAASRP